MHPKRYHASTSDTSIVDTVLQEQDIIISTLLCFVSYGCLCVFAKLPGVLAAHMREG